jgi:hypothetical protein
MERDGSMATKPSEQPKIKDLLDYDAVVEVLANYMEKNGATQQASIAWAIQTLKPLGVHQSDE